MRAAVFTVAGGKGGVGKTTTAVNAGVALAERGYDVALVDADLGMTNLAELLGIDHDTSIHRVLAGEVRLSEALVDGPGGVTVVPGESTVDAYRAADPARLRGVVERLAADTDVVLVDTGAGVSHEALVPFGLADGVVLVTTPADVAIPDTRKTGRLVGEVDGTVLGAVVTRVVDESDPAETAARLGRDVLAAVPEADADAAEPRVVTAPDGDVAAAYRRLATAFETRLHDGEASEPRALSTTNL